MVANNMTIGALQKIYTRPQEATISIALEDFFVLLAHVTAQSKTFLLAHPEYNLSPEEEATLKALIERRYAHEPVAYLIGYKEFYGREFKVTSETLIPRPETEVLIEEVLKHLRILSSPTDVFDIGTGSGAIILTLAEELQTKKDFSFIGTDISPEALVVARENQIKLHTTSVVFQESDLLKKISFAKEKNICIIANLPYVPIKMYEETEPDVQDFEPSIALVSGNDGLDHYRRLIAEIQERKLTNFSLFLEIDPSQTEPLTRLLSNFYPMVITVIKDLTDRERFIKLSTY
jgi:release factor glutamine methyltransferase